ncbi:hypothetical protein PMIT1313_01093 [Prochlorococcus marinus str. MIT 1313]|nr:hypothetical protein PMIT1313_01093 [Prochlorococcus marinus str. MIT 1313]KZR72330.1 hypothetical protein PMIT1318_01390 [Prochlorococcus marinus str. MIT 1318]
MLAIETTGGLFYEECVRYLLEEIKSSGDLQLIYMDFLGGNNNASFYTNEMKTRHKTINASEILKGVDWEMYGQTMGRELLNLDISALLNGEYSLKTHSDRALVAKLTFNGLRLGNYLIAFLYRQDRMNINSSKELCNTIADLLRIYLYCDYLHRVKKVKYAIFTHDVYEKGWTSECMGFLGVKVLHPHKFTYSYSKNINYKVKESGNNCSEYTNHFRWEASMRGIRHYSKDEICYTLKNLIKTPTVDSGDSSNTGIGIEDIKINSLTKSQIVSGPEEIQNLLTHSNREPSRIVFLYMNSFADGLHQNGYSGFPTLDDYYSIAANLVLSFDKKSYLAIKPHPHVFDSRHKERRADLYQLEVDGIGKLIDGIVKEHQSRLMIITPHASNYSILNNNYGCKKLLITHHGSIGIEAQYIGIDVICSSIAPYAELGLNEKTFKDKYELMNLINDVMTGTYDNSQNSVGEEVRNRIETIYRVGLPIGLFNLIESKVEPKIIKNEARRLMAALMGTE